MNVAESETKQDPAPEKMPAPSHPPESLAERIWNFSWNDCLPAPLGSRGITLERSNTKEVFEFAQQNFARIFELDKKTNNAFGVAEDPQAKERYYQEAMDHFAFKRDGKIIGVSACSPVDWSTYYIRITAILPEAQGNLTLSAYVNFILDKMRSLGVKRVQTETSPANMPVLQILSRLRFNQTGLVLTERWGAIALLTKFLDKDAEKTFLDQFCYGNHWQANDSH